MKALLLLLPLTLLISSCGDKSPETDNPEKSSSGNNSSGGSSDGSSNGEEAVSDEELLFKFGAPRFNDRKEISHQEAIKILEPLRDESRYDSPEAGSGVSITEKSFVPGNGENLGIFTDTEKRLIVSFDYGFVIEYRIDTQATTGGGPKSGKPVSQKHDYLYWGEPHEFRNSYRHGPDKTIEKAVQNIISDKWVPNVYEEKIYHEIAKHNGSDIYFATLETRRKDKDGHAINQGWDSVYIIDLENRNIWFLRRIIGPDYVAGEYKMKQVINSSGFELLKKEIDSSILKIGNMKRTRIE